MGRVLPRVFEELLGTIFPIVVYRLCLGLYCLLHGLDRFRIHSRKEEDAKNAISKATIVKGVLFKQSIQAVVSILLFTILNWVQNKFSGRQEKRRSDVSASSVRYACIPESRKEEFDDWPESLLSIGTFGNKDTEEGEQIKQDLHPSQELPGFTLEEVKKLQEELVKLLNHKPPKCSMKESETVEEERANLPLNRFLNCPSSLEVDRTACENFCDDLDSNEDGKTSSNTDIILSKADDFLARNSITIKQGAFTILLKKMVAWRCGLLQGPSLRDPIPQSRIDKILRTILRKKLYHQTSASKSTKKYLENRPLDNMKHHSKEGEKDEDGCKWVKTDSEYIVLEI